MNSIKSKKYLDLVKRFNDVDFYPNLSGRDRIMKVITSDAPCFYCELDWALRKIAQLKKGVSVNQSNSLSFRMYSLICERAERSMRGGETFADAVGRIISSPAPSFFCTETTMYRALAYVRLMKRRRYVHSLASVS